MLVNLQAGWKASAQSSEFETARVAASTTGLKRYLDARSNLLDARRSAEAVRGFLDGALNELNSPCARKHRLPPRSSEAGP